MSIYFQVRSLEAISSALASASVNELSSTCIEDIGRQFLKMAKAEYCIKELESINICGNENKLVLLTLFSILFTYYRRLRIEDKIEYILNKFKNIIEDSPIYIHAKAMWIEKSNLATFNDRLLLSIKYELRALQKDPNYIGAQHKLADLVVQALEEGWQVSSCAEPDIGCIPEHLLVVSKNYLRKLAYENNYSRAYYTLARFYIIEKEYDKAVDLLGRAISLEPASTKDYNLRLAEYYNMLF